MAILLQEIIEITRASRDDSVKSNKTRVAGKFIDKVRPTQFFRVTEFL